MLFGNKVKKLLANKTGEVIRKEQRESALPTKLKMSFGKNRKKERKEERKCLANNTGNVIWKQRKEIACHENRKSHLERTERK
jgi:hypothetical protein